MPNLILIPTPQEEAILKPRIDANVDSEHWAIQLCGFGPVVAAARAAALVSRYKPERVILVGIAGTFDEALLPVGSACRFDRVASYGIGAGSGANFVTAKAMGFEQFAGGAEPHVGDTIPLVSTFISEIPCEGLLLTSCAASATADEVSFKRSHYTDAVAEDMEGFGVATACLLAGVPLQIVRGISNRVGNRNTKQWLIDQALHEAANLVNAIANRAWLPSPT